METSYINTMYRYAGWSEAGRILCGGCFGWTVSSSRKTTYLIANCSTCGNSSCSTGSSWFQPLYANGLKRQETVQVLCMTYYVFNSFFVLVKTSPCALKLPIEHCFYFVLDQCENVDMQVQVWYVVEIESLYLLPHSIGCFCLLNWTSASACFRTLLLRLSQGQGEAKGGASTERTYKCNYVDMRVRGQASGKKRLP